MDIKVLEAKLTSAGHSAHAHAVPFAGFKVIGANAESQMVPKHLLTDFFRSPSGRILNVPWQKVFWTHYMMPSSLPYGLAKGCGCVKYSKCGTL